jgi:MFS transporter, ACS family, glucarate transporter
MPFLRGRVRWLLIGWMFAISAVAFLDRVNISIAGSSIEKDFGLDHVQFGWVLSAFVLGYALFQAPGGRLADRFGARRVLALGTVWWAVFTSLTAFVHPVFSGAFLTLIVVRFLLGVGEAVVYPASNRLVASWIPRHERGVANGFIFAGVGAGAGITPPLITYILINYGWRWSFWVSALIGLAAGVAWYALARDRPQEHPWVDGVERAYIQSGIVSSTEVESSTPLAWRTIFTSKNVAAITFSYFCFGYVAYIFFSWFFIYLSRVRGLDLKSSSYYSMLPFIAMAVGSPLGGWISDRIASSSGRPRSRCAVAFASMALCSIFIAMGTAVHSARLASIVLAGGAGALYLSQSAFWSVTSDIAGHSSGSVSGVMNMGGQIGGVVTASLTPVIAKYFGWGTSFFVAAGVCGIGSLLWFWVHPERELISPEVIPVSVESKASGTQKERT